MKYILYFTQTNCHKCHNIIQFLHCTYKFKVIAFSLKMFSAFLSISGGNQEISSKRINNCLNIMYIFCMPLAERTLTEVALQPFFYNHVWDNLIHLPNPLTLVLHHSKEINLVIQTQPTSFLIAVKPNNQ